MSDPILYHSRGACSLSIHAALRQAEVAFTPVRVDVRAGEQLAGHELTRRARDRSALAAQP